MVFRIKAVVRIRDLLHCVFDWLPNRPCRVIVACFIRQLEFLLDGP